jgi:hypothetical protein
MRWVTRENPKVDRVACPWLIASFIDPDAEILFAPADEVLDIAARDDAISFDAPGARYTHRDGLCTFEVLVEEHGIDDPALRLMARIVHGADIADDRDATPESRGLLAIADGFALLALPDDESLALQMPLYSALYAWCRTKVETAEGVPD